MRKGSNTYADQCNAQALKIEEVKESWFDIEIDNEMGRMWGTVTFVKTDGRFKPRDYDSSRQVPLLDA